MKGDESRSKGDESRSSDDVHIGMNKVQKDETMEPMSDTDTDGSCSPGFEHLKLSSLQK